ncbi:hypothetical protein KIN20_005946 [Parelaphostrongylus tenuis]|uniref:Uncharacterized protein n=1 Tax=Parelaphostrongylus tenuis TaxID=148309 RepID=A0AAD5M5A7_PARTN|nr:hypothetical protein KIN20_005946 [Parelaphostrongylus tenuis]
MLVEANFLVILKAAALRRSLKRLLVDWKRLLREEPSQRFDYYLSLTEPVRLKRKVQVSSTDISTSTSQTDAAASTNEVHTVVSVKHLEARNSAGTSESVEENNVDEVKRELDRAVSGRIYE